MVLLKINLLFSYSCSNQLIEILGCFNTENQKFELREFEILLPTLAKNTHLIGYRLYTINIASSRAEILDKLRLKASKQLLFCILVG